MGHFVLSSPKIPTMVSQSSVLCVVLLLGAATASPAFNIFYQHAQESATEPSTDTPGKCDAFEGYDESCCVITDVPATTEPTATADPKTDEPKTDEPQTDEPTTDEPKTDEPKTDEPKTDEPKTDDPKTDEPKTDEPAPSEQPKEKFEAAATDGPVPPPECCKCSPTDAPNPTTNAPTSTPTESSTQGASVA